MCEKDISHAEVFTGASLPPPPPPPPPPGRGNVSVQLYGFLIRGPIASSFSKHLLLSLSSFCCSFCCPTFSLSLSLTCGPLTFLFFLPPYLFLPLSSRLKSHSPDLSPLPCYPSFSLSLLLTLNPLPPLSTSSCPLSLSALVSSPSPLFPSLAPRSLFSLSSLSFTPSSPFDAVSHFFFPPVCDLLVSFPRFFPGGSQEQDLYLNLSTFDS